MPEDIREAAKKMGLFGFALPEEYGGLGLSMDEEARLVSSSGTRRRRCARCSAPTTASPGTS